MTICGIYKIQNKTNGKFYIGSSVDVKGRFYNHKAQLRRNIHDNQHLQNAWNKYGEVSFDFTVLKECPNDTLIIEEQRELNIHAGKEYCYNISPSADVSMRGVPRSDDVKQKISAALKGKPKWTDAQKKQMSIDRTGRTHSTETKNKMMGRSSSFKNIQTAQQFNIGRVYSTEHCSNISMGKQMTSKVFSNEERTHIKDGVRKSVLEGRYHKNKVPKEEYETIRGLYLSGSINKRQLAFKYGITPSSMQKLLQRIGV